MVEIMPTKVPKATAAEQVKKRKQVPDEEEKVLMENKFVGLTTKLEEISGDFQRSIDKNNKTALVQDELAKLVEEISMYKMALKKMDSKAPT